MRISRRPLDLTIAFVLALCLALTQAPSFTQATFTPASLSLPGVDPLKLVTSLLADSATDTAPVAPGTTTADGSTLPVTADLGVHSSLADGGDVTIGLPAEGAGIPAGPGSIVYEGTHPGTSLVVDRVDSATIPGVASSTRTQIAIDGKSAPSRYEFNLDLPADARLAIQPSGAAYAIDSHNKVIGFFGTPWALDAEGQSVPTRFEAEGSTLVQVVDHRNASYPVVADPWWFVPLVVAGRAVTHKMAVRAATRAAARQAAIAAARRQGYTVHSAGAAVKGNFFTAAGHIIRINGRVLRSNGSRSFAAFKRRYGTREGYEWHHIVERRNVGRFKPWQINNRQNLILIRKGIHRACVSAMMNTKLKNMTKAELRQLGLTRVPANRNLTMRQDLEGFSFANMHLIGLRLLVFCGVKIVNVP